MGLPSFLLIVGTLTYITWWLIKYIRLRRTINKIHGPHDHFILGNATQFKYDADAWQEQGEGVALLWSEPRMFRIWVTVFPYVILTGADEVEPILSSNVHINKSREYKLLWPWLGMGLLTNTGEKWRPRRKLLTPTFHYDILKDFMSVFNKQAKILLKKMQVTAEKGEYFDVYPYVTLCALDIICESAMGQDVNAQQNKDSKYVRAVYLINEIVHERQKRPWLWPDLLFTLFGRGKEMTACLKILHGFTEKVIRERQDALKHSHDDDEEMHEKKRMAFLDLMLNISEKEGWSFLDIRDEVNTFMFEGHDTTSASMNWTLHLLGCYPEIQEKIFNELDSVFGDDNRDVAFEDLKNLTYLERVIKESLRLFPSVPMFGRILDTDVVIADKLIPSGVQVFVNPYAVHRDPKHWENPERFDPDRFLPEKSVGRHPYAYLPFSAGSRNCIGQRFAVMEEKTVLAWILRYYKVKSRHRRDQVRARPELILRPDRGVHVLLEMRRRPHFDDFSSAPTSSL